MRGRWDVLYTVPILQVLISAVGSRRVLLDCFTYLAGFGCKQPRRPKLSHVLAVMLDMI